MLETPWCYTNTCRELKRIPHDKRGASNDYMLTECLAYAVHLELSRAYYIHQLPFAGLSDYGMNSKEIGDNKAVHAESPIITSSHLTLDSLLISRCILYRVTIASEHISWSTRMRNRHLLAPIGGCLHTLPLATSSFASWSTSLQTGILDRRVIAITTRDRLHPS